jgi:predicted DCC family thiol-disulfide oxidoreductase YuxK
MNDVVVYDGDCGICEWSAGWIRKHVPGVDVVSHTNYGIAHLSSVWFVTWSGRREGADAVSHILLKSDTAATRFIGRVIGAPVLRFLAKGIYFVIAKNRRLISRMFGLNACALPPR